MPSPPRFFFVHAPPLLVAAIEQAVRAPGERRQIASELAAAGLHHQRVAAVSERVVADLRKRPQARDNDRFVFAAGSLPYLLAGRDPHEIAEGLRAVGELGGEPEAEAFFAAQGEKLGVQVRQLDRGMQPPTHAELAAWILARLEALAADMEAGALPRLLGRLGPVWSEGRGRWLGALVRTATDPADDARILAGLDVDPLAARSEWGQPDPALPVAASLRALLQPAPGIETHLLAAERHQALAQLFTERWSELAPFAARHLLSEDLGAWRLLVVAALHGAHARADALLEAPDIFRFGYRWPPL